MIEQIDMLLQRATFYHCVLLVHSNVCRLQHHAQELARAKGWPILSVGRLLAEAILSISPKQRSAEAQRVLRSLLSEAGPGTVVCADIDLLFEPMLRLDPLRLLREASRETDLVVAWPGSYCGSVLAYAVPEHSHYRTWRNPEVQVCLLES
ncbi:MAG: BREX-3 system P-loop-containing protein BrxF [Anaerolineae bacterium]|nr:BREX-3 system P-loop-containing protein BrxF [Anaerolineae bacterium]